MPHAPPNQCRKLAVLFFWSQSSSIAMMTIDALSTTTSTVSAHAISTVTLTAKPAKTAWAAMALLEQLPALPEHLDAASLITYMAALFGVLGSAVWAIWNMAYSVYGYCTSTIVLHSDDETYEYLMYWLGKQKENIWSTSFAAGLGNSGINYMAGMDESVTSSRDEETEENLALAAEDFDKYWAQRMLHDKSHPIVYTPSEGTHWLRYHSTWISFNRHTNKVKVSRDYENHDTESIVLTCLGRNPAALRNLLAEAQATYLARDGAETVIYHSTGRGSWQRRASRVARDISTVVLDPVQKDALLEDIRDYLHPLTKKWYRERGIPYRRGYILYGGPGTGKTSLCLALAGMFLLPIYITGLNSLNMSEDSLAQLFASLPSED